MQMQMQKMTKTKTRYRNKRRGPGTMIRLPLSRSAERTRHMKIWSKE